MKNNYLINNKKSKRFIFLLTGLLLFFSCKDLNDLNSTKGSFKNQNENLSIKNLKAINPLGESIYPSDINSFSSKIRHRFELDKDLEGDYKLVFTYSNGTEEVLAFKPKDIEASALNTSSLRRSKRFAFIPFLFSGLVAVSAVGLIKIFVEAVYTPNTPALVPSDVRERGLIPIRPGQELPPEETPGPSQDSPPHAKKQKTSPESPQNPNCTSSGGVSSIVVEIPETCMAYQSSPMNDLLQERVKKLEKRIEDLENSAESNGQITEITDSINRDLESLLSSQLSDKEFLEKIENKVNARTPIQEGDDRSSESNVEERILRLFREINRNPVSIEQGRIPVTNEERERNLVTLLLDQLDNFLVTNYGFHPPSSVFEMGEGQGEIPRELLDEKTIIDRLDKIKEITTSLTIDQSKTLKESLIKELNEKIRALYPREKEAFLTKLKELRGRLYELEAKMVSKMIQSFFLFYQIREMELSIRLKLIPENSGSYELKEAIKKLIKIISKIKESLKTIYSIAESAAIDKLDTIGIISCFLSADINKLGSLEMISSFLNGVVGGQLEPVLRNLGMEYRHIMNSIGLNEFSENSNTKLDDINLRYKYYEDAAKKPIKIILAIPQEFRLDFERDFPNRQNKDKKEDEDEFPDDKYAIGGDPNS